MDAFSPQIYGNYLGLDSVLLHYLDIEGIVQRHQENPSAFETQEALYFLAQRFDLPPSQSFPAFLDRYDAKYATVRSYSLPGAKPKRIILKAAEAGELQAFYLGLQWNPKYKNSTFLDQALRRAVRGNHQVMIDLIKDLGGTSFTEEVRGTAEGGHLEKLKLLIVHGKRLSRDVLFEVTMDAIKFGQLATFKYLISRWRSQSEDWVYLISAAGESRNQSIIDYVISQYGHNYNRVILGAIFGGHLELVMRYMEKLVARDHGINLDFVNDLMSHVRKRTSYDIIEYLISLGGDNYNGLVLQLARYDLIELFKRYYLSSDVDSIHLFNIGLENSSVKVVKFMLEQDLVPTTEKELNSYLEVAGVNSKLIPLLFSLGATDYPSIVERALIQGDFELAEKYFDQAPGLRLNKIFMLCDSIPVYQYLLAKGRIKQKTIDATLAILEEFNGYVREEQYLRSLSLQDVSSPSSD